MSTGPLPEIANPAGELADSGSEGGAADAHSQDASGP
jgi:hypothetical protein